MMNGSNFNRRSLLQATAGGFGYLAFSGMAAQEALANQPVVLDKNNPLATRAPHFAPKAKRVIFMFMHGGPSQVDTFDYKPELAKHKGERPKLVDRKSLRNTKMGLMPSPFGFKQYGDCGKWVSDIFPQVGGVVDDICFIHSMHTEAVNHAPAVTFFLSGSEMPGRPSMGAWLSYGLGTANEDLPTFVAMSSRGSGKGGQPIYDRLWGSGFLPAQYQGVKFRNQGDPVLDISNPPGVKAGTRRKMLDVLKKLNEIKYRDSGDAQVQARIAQYEMAFKMQTSVPGLMDVTEEPKNVLEDYGATPGDGSFASNCLLARRLAERGVRFIQLYHRGWDHHGGVKKNIKTVSGHIDKATAALVNDLKQRGMLEDTLIIWGGEFGRTPTAENADGRDHNPHGFTMWLAGGGIKAGLNLGRTDEYGYYSVEDKVHFHDLHATILHLLGLDHKKLTYRYSGRDFRLTDVHGEVVHRLLA